MISTLRQQEVCSGENVEGEAHDVEGQRNQDLGAEGGKTYGYIPLLNAYTNARPLCKTKEY